MCGFLRGLSLHACGADGEAGVVVVGRWDDVVQARAVGGRELSAAAVSPDAEQAWPGAHAFEGTPRQTLPSVNRALIDTRDGADGAGDVP